MSRRASRGTLSMAKDGEVDRQLNNMARAARKVGPNDRVVELRKVWWLPLVWFGVWAWVRNKRHG